MSFYIINPFDLIKTLLAIIALVSFPSLADSTPANENSHSVRIQVHSESLPQSPLIVLVDGDKLAHRQPEQWQIDQVDKEFVPKVYVVRQGASVYFPNKDDIRHHVYSFSKGNQFELPLYKGTPAQPISFDNMGEVTLGCNIHDWMRGYVLITNQAQWHYLNPRQVAEEGSIIGNLPKQMLTFSLWHPALKEPVPSQTVDLTNTSNSTTTITFKAEFKELIEPKRKRGRRLRRRY